ASSGSASPKSVSGPRLANILSRRSQSIPAVWPHAIHCWPSNRSNPGLASMTAVAEAVRPVGVKHAAFPHGGLIWTLVRTDFKSRYHGTLGGFVWTLLKPVSMFVVLMAVFSFLFAAKPTYRLNLIVGLFLWEFFAEGTKSGLMSLYARGFLLNKARVPSW